MAKVFTIAPGLENMGAMKTGGQGSVYKGRRVGEITTAIKLLPTPIFSENEDDKNYRDFQNEVNKLKKVNEEPNPNVVKILSAGLSETGNFPFIEMEYIEGPDLEELLQPPHDKIFTVKEVIKVAEHLSHALAHCHRKDVKHGDIKSNNVKYNINSGNYVLLDFGLAIMTDEQRRTSLRKAGAVEFMAPEQNEGLMLFETDVYSFGVILFELLAGSVPFPLENKSETARNHVRLAHLETIPPDVMALRREALPAEWSAEKRERELKVPEWIINLVYKCLKKKPENRFKNGIELHSYIIHHGIHTPTRAITSNYALSDNIETSQGDRKVQEQLKLVYEKLEKREKEVDQLKTLLISRDNELETLRSNQSYQPVPQSNGVSKGLFTALLLLTIALAGFSAYSYMNNKKQADKNQASLTEETDVPEDNQTTTAPVEQQTTEDLPPDTAGDYSRKMEALRRKQQSDSIKNAEKAKAVAIAQQNSTEETTEDATVKDNQNNQQTQTEVEKPKSTVQFMVVSKAYFHNSADETTRRAAFIIPSNNAIVSALDEQNGFIYVNFTSSTGLTTKGWLRKQDLQQVSE
jgi:serine/threonine protein kinase